MIPKFSKKRNIGFRFIMYILAGVAFTITLIVAITSGGLFTILGIPISITRTRRPFVYGLVALMIECITSIHRNPLYTAQSYLSRQKIMNILILLLIPIFILQFGYFLTPEDNVFWDLDEEDGIGTYYAGFLLFIVGSIIYNIYCIEKRKTESKVNGWLPILILFWAISVEELLAIHGRIPDYLNDIGLFSFSMPRWYWVFFLAPFAVIIIVFMAKFFFQKFRKYKNVLLLAVISLALWIVAYFSEMLMGTNLNSQIQISIEEGVELLGTSFFGLTFLLYLRIILKRGNV